MKSDKTLPGEVYKVGDKVRIINVNGYEAIPGVLEYSGQVHTVQGVEEIPCSDAFVQVLDLPNVDLFIMNHDVVRA